MANEQAADASGKILREFIPLQEQEGASKVMPLREAIEKHISLGMTLHLGVAPVPCYGAIFELVRVFKDRDPGFTLASLGLTTVHSLLVHTGMVRKAITTYLGDSYPSPAPNPVYQKAFREGRLQVEQWSLLSLVLRFKAAAMGLSHLPTRSLLGSSMEASNAGDFISMEDPFQAGGRIGLVRPLAPDVSIYHGVAADEQGNTIFLPPYAENLYAALASRRGVIVTVEKIVSTKFIRGHAGFVRLPANRVLSVSEVPMGGHPGGCSTHELPEIQGYAVDNPFILDWRQACKKPETLETWMKEWVLDCPKQASYIEKLGPERVQLLREKAHPDSWQKDVRDAAPRTGLTDPSDAPAKAPANAAANAMERMVVAAARLIMNRVKRNGCRTLLAGIGASNLAAWMATYLLRREKYDLDVMAEVGFFGYLPRPADPFIFNLTNIPTCKMLTDIVETLGVFVGGCDCLGVLSAAQVDRFGNINSTMIPPDMLITGSGGGNDVASCASEVLLVVPQSPFRYVAQVPYITAPGDRVKTLVSTFGVFEKLEGDRELTLTAVLDDGNSGKDEMIRTIKSQCGWNLKIAPSVETIAPPAPEELALLRLFDPGKIFISE